MKKTYTWQRSEKFLSSAYKQKTRNDDEDNEEEDILNFLAFDLDSF